MDSHLTVAIYFIYICLGLIGAGMLLLFWFRIRALGIAKKTQMYLQKHQNYFIFVQTHLNGAAELQLPPGKLTKLERRVIQQKLIEWIEQFKGDLRDKLVKLCHDAGFVRDDIKLLDSLFYGRRISAAYRLGGMRAAEAVPRMLLMMEKQKYSPLTIVIARAIAKSAERGDQLKEMLHHLLRHGKPIHNMAADIVMETGLDASRLLLKLLEDENPDFVKVALVAMWGQAVPEVVPALDRLVGAEEDVRAEAVKLYLSSNPVLKDETIAELMANPDSEIRAEVAKTLGNMHAAGSIPLLRTALKDQNWRVRNNSAESLAKLGDTGFEVLCQVAKHGSGIERETALHHIEKTMLEESEHQKLDQMVAYNKKKLLYERYFGVSESKPVRQVAAVGGDYTA
ncbi:HEAT repeat protein [Fontibacillus phaseoli]|uniref:HEAT repeat protein n=1 Tax=Fontibacillus phaseoli TaxID=1416533 RepID=A0A369BR65_9BACL|nr:HEAT repeat domain-containing protein [Fontibacillus phaseoli]RCX23086.1 HEAT repeat protein [Fontibacillus phaseoli]